MTQDVRPSPDEISYLELLRADMFVVGPCYDGLVPDYVGKCGTSLVSKASRSYILAS